MSSLRDLVVAHVEGDSQPLNCMHGESSVPLKRRSGRKTTLAHWQVVFQTQKKRGQGVISRFSDCFLPSISKTVPHMGSRRYETTITDAEKKYLQARCKDRHGFITIPINDYTTLPGSKKPLIEKLAKAHSDQKTKALTDKTIGFVIVIGQKELTDLTGDELVGGGAGHDFGIHDFAM